VILAIAHPHKKPEQTALKRNNQNTGSSLSLGSRTQPRTAATVKHNTSNHNANQVRPNIVAKENIHCPESGSSS
jgi:hypothetical protein